VSNAVVFGGTGLLGCEVVRTRPPEVTSLLSPDRSCADLSGDPNTWHSDSIDNVDLWINCAARVGGVKANTELVGNFYLDNIRIGSNVLETARTRGVKKLVSVLSTCIYPDEKYVTYPLTEDQLHNGPPHDSNFGYAYAKRMLDVQSRAYRNQHGCDFITVVPNNLYGPHDNYDINGGHVIPSLIRKFYEASLSGSDVTVWGTGRPLREFTFARDAAQAIWWAAQNYSGEGPVNIGNTEETSIGDLASLIGRLIGFRGRIKFDHSKPDGQHRKPSSNKKMNSLGFSPKYTPLEVGLRETIDHFVSNYPHVRGI
jgi:GDP-L-fucose synthase